MEFACGFVYVPPLTKQHNVPKRSALLPPPRKIRPCRPPPPPPVPPEKPHSPPAASPEKRILAKMRGDEDSKRTGNNLHKYENFFKANTDDHAPQGQGRPPASLSSSPGIRKALLPPPMKAHLGSLCPTVPITHALQDLNFNSQEDRLTYELPREEPEIKEHPYSDPEYSYTIPEGSGVEQRHLLSAANSKLPGKSAPPLPPRPSFMMRIPEYLILLPTSTTCSPPTAPEVYPHTPAFAEPASQDNHPLPGNPNIILVSLGILVTEENAHTMLGLPTSCSRCGSALDSYYDNTVDECYFCQPWEPATSLASQLNCPPTGCQDCLFILNPDEPSKLPAESLLIFCIAISRPMCTTSQCVQQAMMQCICSLSERKPQTRVGLITFSNQVTLHGYGQVPTRVFQGAELINSDYLKEAALSFPSPLPLSENRGRLESQLQRRMESGAIALGPAALIAITMASREAGSKVIICTDGKANTEMGNLDVDDNDSHSLMSSTIFYQDLGEYAANQGVLVSVLSIEGTDCRLDELGKLADRTGGKVAVASPGRLHTELLQVLESRTVATHCSVTLLLPPALTVKREIQQGHKVIREVGNVTADKEITFMFRAREQATQMLLSAGCVSVQLQIRYRQMNGQTVLRVLSVDRRVTQDSSLVLSSLSLPVLQLDSSQACAALAVRGRYKDAQAEGEIQRNLMARALNHIRSSEEKQQHIQWVESMDHIYNNIHNHKRNSSGPSTCKQSLTDTGAALLYGMKNGNMKSISLKIGTKPNQ